MKSGHRNMDIHIANDALQASLAWDKKLSDHTLVKILNAINTRGNKDKPVGRKYWFPSLFFEMLTFQKQAKKHQWYISVYNLRRGSITFLKTELSRPIKFTQGEAFISDA